MAKKGTREKNLIVRSQFVAVVEQVLVNGTSHWPMDDKPFLLFPSVNLCAAGGLVSPRFPPVRGSFFARLAAPSPPPRRFPLRVLEKTGYNRAEGIGVRLMVLTLGDLELLKQLRGAGGLGRNVRELKIRVTLDRLVKGGYLVGRPIDQRSVQYRITQRGQDAIVEHDF